MNQQMPTEFPRPFMLTSGMESQIANLDGIFVTLAHFAQEMGERDEATIIATLCNFGFSECRRLGEVHRELFQLLHPDREHVEREGRPADRDAIS